MDQYIEILEQLIGHSESEVVEFKAAENSFDFDDLGRYFSALSNEANLRGLEYGWLVFGVENKKHLIVGTRYKDGENALNRLKQDMSQHTTDNLIFRNIIPVQVEGKRVLMFQIPAAPRNMVVCWKGIAYGRDGESLKPLNQAKRDEIRFQDPIPDWSAELIPEATIDDLDDMALAKARVMFKRVHAANIPAEEVDGWTMETFLSNSSMMRDGKLTRAAILLLGKPTSLSKIHPAVARITWTLEDRDAIVLDYEHFTIPFILTVDSVLGKIRNMTMRELPGGTLFPETMKQYDDYTIRETLHNALAHQDYRLKERITFVERPDSIYCSNGGSFIPGTIEEALEHKGPQRHYRNDCLCQGMVNFNMIDTVGRGIKKMFTEQQKRYFPMPDYEIDNDKAMVGVTIYGKMIDERYSALLKSGESLSLQECIWLDAVQKNKKITSGAISALRKRGLIEGRSPKYFISQKVALMTKQLPEYSRKKGLDKAKLMNMIVQFLQNANGESMKRDAIFDYVRDVLPKYEIDQQERYLGNVLTDMKTGGIILANGRKWQLSDLSYEDIQKIITKITTKKLPNYD